MALSLALLSSLGCSSIKVSSVELIKGPLEEFINNTEPFSLPIFVDGYYIADIQSLGSCEYDGRLNDPPSIVVLPSAQSVGLCLHW